MKSITRAVLVVALGFGACASAPTSVQELLVEQPIPAWPASVADTCPERTVSVECFRGHGLPKAAVYEGMANLVEQLHGCIRRDAVPVEVMLTIETRGGSPTCVDRSVRDNETARCAATIVARDLNIPDSTPDETCRLLYPLKFAWGEEHARRPHAGGIQGLPPDEAVHLGRMGLHRCGGPPDASTLADTETADLPQVCLACSGCSNTFAEGLAPSTSLTVARPTNKAKVTQAR